MCIRSTRVYECIAILSRRQTFPSLIAFTGPEDIRLYNFSFQGLQPYKDRKKRIGKEEKERGNQ